VSKGTVYLYVPGSEDWSWDSESSGPSYAPYVTLSAKVSRRPYSARVWQSRPWIQLLWPTIFNPSMADRGVESFIASLRVPLASHSVRPADAKAKPTSDGSEKTSSESLMRFDPKSSSWRMSQGSLLGDSTPSSEDWKKLKQGGARSGVCFVRTQRYGVRTAGKGSSWSRNEQWPTPGVGSPNSQRGAGQDPAKRRAQGHQVNLMDAVSVWPTPRTISGGAESAERKQELGRTASGGGDLQAAAKAWPTPTAGDSKASGSRNVAGSKAHAGMSLTDLVTTGDSHGRAWVTPGPNDFKGSSQPGQRRGQLDEQVSHRFHLDLPTPTPGEQSSSDILHSLPLSKTWQTPVSSMNRKSQRAMSREGNSRRGGGQRSTPGLEQQVEQQRGPGKARLNPNFVDWLMGWPPGWSACEPLETASFRSWQRVHSSLLRDVLG